MQGTCNHHTSWLSSKIQHPRSVQLWFGSMIHDGCMVPSCMIHDPRSVVQAPPTLILVLDWSSDAWRLVRLARRRLRRLARRCTEASSTVSSTPSETQHTRLARRCSEQRQRETLSFLPFFGTPRATPHSPVFLTGCRGTTTGGTMAGDGVMSTLLAAESPCPCLRNARNSFSATSVPLSKIWSHTPGLIRYPSSHASTCFVSSTCACSCTKG